MPRLCGTCNEILEDGESHSPEECSSILWGEQCDICGRTCGGVLSEQERKLARDHDHKTGKRRGRLCIRCNLGLGFFQDDIAALENAIVYLGTYSSQEVE